MGRTSTYPIRQRLKERDLKLAQLHRRLLETDNINYNTLLRWCKSGEVPVRWMPYVIDFLGPIEQDQGAMDDIASWVEWAVTTAEGKQCLTATGANALPAILSKTLKQGDKLYARHTLAGQDAWFEYEWRGDKPWRALPDGLNFGWRTTCWYGRATGAFMWKNEAWEMPGGAGLLLSPEKICLRAYKNHRKAWDAIFLKNR